LKSNYVHVAASVVWRFGGLVVSMLASGTQVRGFKPGQSHRIFRAKNPQLAFLLRRRKTVCLMSQISGMEKNPKITVEVAIVG
jgi:hypothetical protein